MYVKLLENYKKIIIFTSLLILTFIFAPLLFLFIKETRHVNRIENIIKNAEITTQNTYKPTEELRFLLDLKEDLNFSYTQSLLLERVLAQGQNTHQENDLIITIKISNTNTKKILPLDFDIHKQSPTAYLITGKNTTNAFVPGKYQLQIDVQKGKAKGSVTQDFSWGVLAINTNKSVYALGDTAKIHLAVLDEKGGMVCDANLELVITSPQGKSTILSSQDGSIITNPECQSKELVAKPDYEAQYSVDESGLYQMNLSATTQNGQYQITDSFEVKSEVLFEVERITATRIYPENQYPVIYKVIPNTNYTGVLTEIVPSSFAVEELDRKLFDLFTGEKGLPYSQLTTIAVNYPNQEIVWSVNWQSGKPYYLGYKYDAPNISPQFYLFGPSSIKSSATDPEDMFTEARQWQVAVDEAPTGEWWDGNYRYRKQITVTTYANTPSGGYDGYTVQFDIDTATDDGKFLDGCNDLRIAHWNGSYWDEVPRHVIDNDCNNSSTDVRFQLQANISASSTDDTYYAYYGYSSAGTPTAVSTTNVYAWYDDASSDIESSYTQGRVDETAHGSNWGDTLAWNASGYYTFDTDDNYTESLRPTGLTERDIYVEYQEYHTNAYPTDMTSGPLVRWEGTGSGASESSSHWYYYEMADSSQQGGGYNSHDDITADNRSSVVLAHGTLSTFPNNSLTIVGIAAWGVNDTNLAAFYDESPTSSKLGGFGASARFSGTHDAGSDNENAGQFGIWLQQDAGYIKNILARRYTIPEPSLSLGSEERVITVSGRIFTDEGTTGLNCSTSRTVAIKVNGVGPRTAECTNSPSNGTYSINGVLVSSGDTLAVFVDNEGEDATTITETDGTSDLSNIDLYQNHVIVRHDHAGSLTIDDMNYYDNGNDGDIAFTATSGSPDTLTVNDGHELYVWTGDTFEPDGNVTVDDIKIVGTYTATGTESITVSGSWNHSGTFNAASSTVYFDAISTTEDIFTTGSGAFNNVEFDDSSGSATWEVEDPVEVDGNFTITNGTVDIVSGENNQINIGGNWTNDDIFEARSGTVVFDGAVDATLDSGCIDEDTCTNEDFYNLTINKAEDATVTLSNTNLRVTNLLNVVTGWLIQGSLNIRAEGNTAIDIDDFGRWSNTSTGDITLGGNVLNDGNITLNANGMSCRDNDDITIASTSTTSRSWNGAGGFRISDVTVSYQTGSAVIYAASSTNSGNMGSNWRFIDCNEFLFEGINFEGLDVD